MTMRELAKLANVSVSTVSKAFHDADDISEETRENIFSIAREYGCYGKYYKGKYHKKIIAVICHELASNYYSGFVEKLQEIIEANDGIAVISANHFSDEKQAELIDYYASYLQVDGILVFGLRRPLKKGYDIPIVSIFSSVGNAVDEITVDIHTPLREAVELLAGLGHRRMAFFGEPYTRAKANTFLEAMKRIPDSRPLVVESPFRFEKAGEDCAEILLEKMPDCTAVICGYDNIAFGAIKRLKKRGYSVPEDISVIGFDNLNVGRYMEMELTSIDTYPEEICQLAWDLLSKKLKNKFFRSNQQILIKGKIIPRDSVAKAKSEK